MSYNKKSRKFWCEDCKQFLTYSHADIQAHNRTKRHIQNSKRNKKLGKGKQAVTWSAGYGEDTDFSNKFEVTAQNASQFRIDKDKGSQDISRQLLDEVKQDKIKEMLEKKRQRERGFIEREEIKPVEIGGWTEVKETKEVSQPNVSIPEISFDAWKEKEENPHEYEEEIDIPKIASPSKIKSHTVALKRKEEFNFVAPKRLTGLNSKKSFKKPILE